METDLKERTDYVIIYNTNFKLIQDEKFLFVAFQFNCFKANESKKKNGEKNKTIYK